MKTTGFVLVEYRGGDDDGCFVLGTDPLAAPWLLNFPWQRNVAGCLGETKLTIPVSLWSSRDLYVSEVAL